MRMLCPLLLATLLVGACVPPGLAPRVTRRYAQMTRVPDTTLSAELTAFSLPVPDSRVDGILALAPEAQAAFVRGVAAHAKTGPAIAAGIAAPIQAEGRMPGSRNLARISRRVVFSVENRSPFPADRLHSVRIRMGAPDGTSFVSWDKIATRHNVVDVGTLTFKQGSQVGGELGLALPVLGAAPKVSSTATSALDESVTLRERVVDLNGALTPREAVLLQQSTAGLDLTGNVVADFVVTVSRSHPEWFYSFSGDGKTCAQQPVLHGAFNTIPSYTRPDSAAVVLDYVLRRVQRGDATRTESDDWVSFAYGAHGNVRFELIPTSALLVHSWMVRTDHTPDGVLQLQSQVGGLGLETSRPVQFASYEDAERMVQWLRRCNGKIPGFDAFIRRRQPDVQRLFIDRVEANTDPVVS